MVADEKIVAALISTGTAAEAAAELGVSAQTIYRRLNTKSLQMLYKSVKADLLRTVVNDLADARCDALEVVMDIMNDITANPAVRLQAAQCVLANDTKYTRQLAEEERALQELETLQAAEKWAVVKAVEIQELNNDNNNRRVGDTEAEPRNDESGDESDE